MIRINDYPNVCSQVQSLSEAVHRNGHQLVDGDHFLVVRRQTAQIRVVHNRSDQHSAGCHNLHYFRLEGQDQATAHEAFRLRGQ